MAAWETWRSNFTAGLASNAVFWVVGLLAGGGFMTLVARWLNNTQGLFGDLAYAIAFLAMLSALLILFKIRRGGQQMGPPMAEPAPPSLASTAPKSARFTGEAISVQLKNADIRDALRTFAKLTGLNVVVDHDVSGSVTASLENVPWDKCLDAILQSNYLGYVVGDDVMRVARSDRLAEERGQKQG